MLTTEELFLLLTTDSGTIEGWGTQRGYGLTAALLTDLAMAGKIELDEKKDPRVSPLVDEPTGNPLLDGVLTRIQNKPGKKMSSLVMDRRLDPTKAVGADLAAAGIVSVTAKRMLGLSPEKYPTVNPEPERLLRQRLAGVLAGGQATPADAVLLSVLQALGVAAKVLDQEKGSLGKRELKQRISQIAEHTPAADAVRRAIDAVTTVIVVAAASSVAATSG